MARRIPAAGINLFQLIYVLIREYREKTGREPLNLSLGNPDGVPPESIRRLKAKYALDPGYDYHTYAEDKNLLFFAEGMVELHGGLHVAEQPHLRALPIAGHQDRERAPAARVRPAPARPRAARHLRRRLEPSGLRHHRHVDPIVSGGAPHGVAARPRRQHAARAAFA